MGNKSGMTHAEALELVTRLSADFQNWSERQRIDYFMQNFALHVVPMCMDLRQKQSETDENGEVIAGAMMASAMAGFLKGMEEARATTGIKQGVDAVGRDTMSEVYTRMAEVTFECARVAGIDFEVFTRYGKSKHTDPSEIMRRMKDQGMPGPDSDPDSDSE